jgi:hypothetical protein
VLHIVFAFRGVFHDPLRDLRLDAHNLLVSVRLDTQARNSSHAVSKACARSLSALGPKANLRSIW